MMETNDQNAKNWTATMRQEDVEKLKEILGRYSEKNGIHREDRNNN